MEWEIIAPMIATIVLFLVVGGVVLLKPVMNQLVELLEVTARSRSRDTPESELAHLRDLLERLDSRMTLLEDRQDFTERLLQARSVRMREGGVERLGAGSTPQAPE